jgi:FKBP-type peptidyl-prolyl cis-trans isomerase
MMTLIRACAPELVATTMFVLGFAAAAAAAQAPPAPDNVAAPPADATTTASGLAHKLIDAGDGTTHPGPKDNVVVHYTGWLANGSSFDSSVERGEPLRFPLDGVIAGWGEGVQLMVVGEKRRFWIPASLGYGSRSVGGIPPNSNLVFDVELLAIQ